VTSVIASAGSATAAHAKQRGELIGVVEQPGAAGGRRWTGRASRGCGAPCAARAARTASVPFRQGRRRAAEKRRIAGAVDQLVEEVGVVGGG